MINRGDIGTLPNMPLHATVPPQGHRSIIERLARAAGPRVNGKALDGHHRPMDEHQKSLKTAWKARTRSKAREAFPLEDSLMAELFAAVAAAVENSGCDHSLAATERWLDSHKLPREETIVWLKANGGYCDCEVVANAADHWEQNR